MCVCVRSFMREKQRQRKRKNESERECVRERGAPLTHRISLTRLIGGTQDMIDVDWFLCISIEHTHCTLQADSKKQTIYFPCSPPPPFPLSAPLRQVSEMSLISSPRAAGRPFASTAASLVASRSTSCAPYRRAGSARAGRSATRQVTRWPTRR